MRAVPGRDGQARAASPVGWLCGAAMGATIGAALGQEPGQPVLPVVPEGGLELQLSDEIGTEGRRVGTATDSPAVTPIVDRGARRGLRLELSGTTKFDDNVRRTDFDEAHAVILQLEPRVYLEGGFSRSRFVLGYEGRYAAHVDLSIEDFDDHNFIAEADLGLHRKVRLLTRGGMEWGHDERGGITSRVISFDSPDRWREHRLGMDLVLGRRIAKAEVRGIVDLRGRRYLNNGQSTREFEERTLWGEGRYNLTPRVAAILEGGRSMINYLDARSRLDGNRSEVLYGIAWEATEKTSGVIKLGQTWREFNDSTFDERKSSSWDARINWAPRPYSRFTFYTNRDEQEAAGVAAGGTVNVQVFGARWRHGFSERTELEFGVERALTNFSTAREDRLTFWDVELRHTVRRWLDIAAGFEVRRRSSNVPLADYRAHIIYLRLDTHFDRRLGR